MFAVVYHNMQTLHQVALKIYVNFCLETLLFGIGITINVVELVCCNWFGIDIMSLTQISGAIMIHCTHSVGMSHFPACLSSFIIYF